MNDMRSSPMQGPVLPGYVHAYPAAATRSLANRAAGSAFRDQLVLALSFLLLVFVVVVLSLVGGSSVARPLYMVAALGFATVTRRRSPWLFLTATLWFWLATSLVRRLIEWHSGFVTTDIVLITPNLMAMFILQDMLTTRGLFARRGVGYAMLILGCVLYGLFVSFFRGDVLPGAIGAADWVVPVLYLFLFLCHAERIDEAEAHLGAFLTFSLIFVVPYTLYQYFVMPPWDAQWMISAGMGSLGNPLPMGSRVFGPLNNPGFVAIWCGTCVVLLSHFRNKLLLVLAPFIFLVVAIAMVRAVYGAVALALAVGALTGRGGFGRVITIVAVAGLSAYVGAAALNPHVTDQITTRFSTLNNLSQDGSAEVRSELWVQSPALINANPLGLGIGSQGRSNVVGGSHADTVNIDAGPLSIYMALGWIPGTLYILGMLLIQARALTIGRRCDSPIASTMAAAAIVPLATIIFLNVIQFEGVVLWTCLGYALAVDARASSGVASAGSGSAMRRPADRLSPRLAA